MAGPVFSRVNGCGAALSGVGPALVDDMVRGSRGGSGAGEVLGGDLLTGASYLDCCDVCVS